MATLNMRQLRVINRTKGSTLGESVSHAKWWWQRFRGLLGTTTLAEGSGLIIEPCRAIHMHGMKYPLDVVFVDRKGRVRALYSGIKPGERTERIYKARAAIELPVGTLERSGTEKGDLLEWV